MQILNQSNASFRSVYSVYPWISETALKYYPTVKLESTKAANGKLIRVLNKAGKESVNTPNQSSFPDKLAHYIAEFDNDFKKFPVVRSFYNYDGGLKYNCFEPIAYIVTGEDVQYFDNKFARPISEAKSALEGITEKVSAELNSAITDYRVKGGFFIKQRAKEFKDSLGNNLGLHVKFLTNRDKTGKIHYEVEDAKFLPEKGPINPFVKLGYTRG